MNAAATFAASDQPITPFRRAIVILVIALTGIAGIQLFILGDQTAAFFAWTVNPPLSAAFLGAAFWAVTAATVAIYVLRQWDQLSLLLPVGTIVTALVLIATLLHLDKFHLTSSDPGPLVAAWVWLGVYLVVPPLFVVMWVAQLRQPAAALPGAARAVPVRPMPIILRAGLIAVGLAAAVVSVILFLSPGTLAWPWTLTPLTSRMTGAFLTGAAVAMLGIGRVNDADRFRFAGLALIGFGILELLAVGRFSSNFDAGAVGWVWLAFVVATAALGAWIVVLDTSARRR